MDPTVTLPSLKLANLDGPGVVGLVSFLSVATSFRHLTIANLMQKHHIRSVMSACRQNGSLHSISVACATKNDTESCAEWACLHAVFVYHTTAFCNRNMELPSLLSGPASLDETDVTSAELFPMLIFVAQQPSRTGTNAVFAGLVASKDKTIGPDHNEQKYASGGNKRSSQSSA
jgi:hypothetical protein